MLHGFILRYQTERVDDGLPPGGGAFLARSSSTVSALKLPAGDDDAKRLFDRLLGVRNDVDLRAEEYDPRSKRHWGNFPQALSPIALINAAFEFMRVSSPGEQQARSEAAKSGSTSIK